MHGIGTRWINSSNKRYVVMGVVLAVVFALSALTAGLPPTKPDYVRPSDDASASTIDSGDTAWVLASSALVLLMTPGVSFFYGGSVGHKNVISTMYQSFVVMGIVTFLWVIVGFSLAFGKDANGSGIFGYPSSYFMFNNVGANSHALAPTIPMTAFAMFQLMFAIITPSLISGSMAERVNFNSWILFVGIWHLVVWCPLAHMSWHPDGILLKFGVLDFAGGIAVEMASGFGALAGAIFLGPRKIQSTSPSNIPFVMLGTAMFWFGWLGFNAGSAYSANILAGQAFVNTQVAGASSMITWILIDIFLGKPATMIGACNGCIVGLVAITPGAGWITTGSSLCTGCIAAIVCFTFADLFKSKSSIDDTIDVTAIHGVGGLVGFLLTGVFCCKDVNPAGFDGLIYGHGMTLARHIAVVLVLIPCIIGSTYLCILLADFFIPMRVTEEEEDVGLDKSMHNESLHTHDILPLSSNKTTFVPSTPIELSPLEMPDSSNRTAYTVNQI